MDRGAWQATVDMFANRQTRLSNEHFDFLAGGVVSLTNEEAKTWIWSGTCPQSPS